MSLWGVMGQQSTLCVRKVVSGLTRLRRRVLLCGGEADLGVTQDMLMGSSEATTWKHMANRQKHLKTCSQYVVQHPQPHSILSITYSIYVLSASFSRFTRQIWILVLTMSNLDHLSCRKSSLFEQSNFIHFLMIPWEVRCFPVTHSS